MTTIEYCPRVPLHTSTYSVGSSDPSNLDQHTSDVSDDSWSIYVLSDPPSALPTPAAPHLSTCSTCAAFSPPSRLMPMDESENSSTGAIPGSSTEVTHDWECVRSVRGLSTNADTNGDSKCSIKVRDSIGCTPHDTVPLDESESSAPDEDALHDAHRWDLVPEYSPFGVSRDTLSLRMHGRPLELRRLPPEQSHRSPPHPEVPALPPTPHTRIRLPLLSVFASLLSIDDATVRLVAHSPSHSALFPGPIRPSNEGTETAQEIHGILALLAPSRPHAVLRDGLAVACDESILPSNPFKMLASPLIDLVGLVRGIWAGGRATLREVYG